MDMLQCKKIGILGGTFDPVHLGHIGLARDAMQQVKLDKVVFIPAKLQPFKLDKKVTDAKDRLAMLRLAADACKGFEISRYEIDNDSISYTYLTLRHVRKTYGDECKIYFITGTDSFLKIETWKESREILSNYSFIIGTRPGYRADELKSCIDRIHSDYNTEIRNIDNMQLDISSTEIRRKIYNGESTKGLLPANVERYIIEHGLYC